jgi:hypothetical protein
VTALRIIQTLLGLAFSYYIFKGLLGKMTESDWTKAFVVLMAVFVVAYARSQLGR